MLIGRHHSLRYQCAGKFFEAGCRALALVYYQAVRAFGREAPSAALAFDDEASSAAVTIDDEAYNAYVAAVEAYNAEVEKAGHPEGRIEA